MKRLDLKWDKAKRNTKERNSLLLMPYLFKNN